MKCIYVALNQMSAHDVDLLMITKRDTSDRSDQEWTCVREELVRTRVRGPAARLLFKPAAGHCRTSGMCTWSQKKEEKSAWTSEGGREGEGSLCFSFHSLHWEIMGLSQADSVTSFCEFHTKGRIMDGGPDRVDGDSGMFSWQYLIHKGTLKMT